MQGPLHGIKILDLSRVLAGPYCTMILGDLGAEVIKVESPLHGDETRKWGPPFQNNVSAYYLCTNRYKKSITIDLKLEIGNNILKKIITQADVHINNYISRTLHTYSI